MEYYKLLVPDPECPSYISVNNGVYKAYSSAMKEVKWFYYGSRSKRLEKYTLITDDDELAKLILVLI